MSGHLFKEWCAKAAQLLTVTSTDHQGADTSTCRLTYCWGPAKELSHTPSLAGLPPMSLPDPNCVLVGSLNLACTLSQSVTPRGTLESQFRPDPAGCRVLGKTTARLSVWTYTSNHYHTITTQLASGKNIEAKNKTIFKQLLGLKI